MMLPLSCGGRAERSASEGDAGGPSMGSGVAFGGTAGAGSLEPGGGSAGSVGGSPSGVGASGGRDSSKPCADRDSDGDGLTDRVEGFMASLPEYASDDDHDGTPNYLDLDADGDKMADADEAGPHEDCSPGRDTDLDGLPDFRDTDSDDDGALDSDEVQHGFDPRSTDSNQDGCGDLRELTFGVCDDEHVVLGGKCQAEVLGSVTLRARDDIPPGLSDVTLVVEPAMQGNTPAQFNVVAFEPADSGSLVDGQIATLNPGASVVIEFLGDVFPRETSFTYLYQLSLESPSEGVIASGGLLWVYSYCERFK